jgi:hypothetical protein
MAGERRRDLLRRLGAGGLLGLAGCQQAPGTEPPDGGTPTATEPDVATTAPPRTTTDEAVPVDALETDRLVGAHYYPWYEMHGGHVDWAHRTPLEPVLGEYAADDPAVVEQHLAWCLEHGLGWLSVSWWGAGSSTDTVLEGTLLGAKLFEHVQFSILYETLDRLGEYGFDLDDPAARDRLREDLTYLAETYFGEDNYLHLDGRPVVYFYISDRLRGDVEAAFETATSSLAVDPYVLASVPFDNSPDSYPVVDVADGVTSYLPYVTNPDRFHEAYAHGNAVVQLGAAAADLEYIPVVIPGYNNTDDPRSDDDPVLSASPNRYETVCNQVAPHLAESEAVLVTSFNEWYETTAIEPHETHGTAYLELTADRLATGTYPAYDPEGVTLRFAFDETFVPAEVSDSTDIRALSFMAGRLDLLDGDTTVRSYDVGEPASEPAYPKGSFGAESAGGTSWRWFGGQRAEMAVFVEDPPPGVDGGVLRGQPYRSDAVEADVYYGGTLTDHLVFGERGGFEEYAFSLTAAG